MKKINFCLLLGLFASSIAMANPTLRTLSGIESSQDGYTFGGATNSWRTQSDGQAGASCTIEHQGSLISIRARLQPSPSVSSTPIIEQSAIVNTQTNSTYRGTWTLDNTNPDVVKNNYNPSTLVYTPVSALVINSGFYFTVSVGSAPNTVTKRIILYPNGFYVAQTPGSHLTALYMPGC